MAMENALNWLIEQASKLISGGLVGICKLLAEQTHVFIFGAIIGALFLIVGKKDTGNKIMSTSIILYFALKVVSVVC